MNITVIILNWLRPKNIDNIILPILVKCPLVNEIIISHGRPDTFFFPKVHIFSKNIINRKDFELNTVFGLSLRFIAALDATNDHILFIDDDVIPHPATIINMVQKYERRYPCIVGKYGRKVLRNLDYSSKPQYDKRSPIALTSLVLVPKILCQVFLDRMESLYPFVNKFSKPLWNGEDIFLSLLSIYYFNKLPYIVSNDTFFPVMKIDNNKEVAISNDPNHVTYRGQLIREIIKHFGNSCTKFQGFFANNIR